MEITNSRLHRIDLPMRRPFVTADGPVSSRRIALVEVLGGGSTGWGEAAPYPGQDQSIDVVVSAARGRGASPTFDAAVDQAVADWRARRSGQSLVASQGDRIPISVAVGLEDPIETVGALVDKGIGRFKVKVAPGQVGHVRRLRADHPTIVLGLDANRSFDAQTIGELDELADVGVAYVEEPVRHRDRQTARHLRSRLEAPIFVDESVTAWMDVTAALADPTVDGLTIKPGRLGWSGAVKAAEAAEVAGKLWRASGLLETGIGRAFTDSLASRSAAISDVAPAELFFEQDLAPSRWLDDGTMGVPDGPGVGVEPLTRALDRYTVEVLEFDFPVNRAAGRANG